ncbi:MAG: BlaI/MecI/CopY family transcriptional regulator [Eubacteriales bacterium]|nr:BlaI/MecI/CopY family transcriptional regulator [Eubacteriales bacterium]
MKNIRIAEAELPVMKLLWERGALTSTEILASLSGNKNTLKTFLKRLVEKGAVATEEIKSRTFRYRAVVTQEEYINQERKGFLDRVFDGSAQDMLLNFVKEEKLTRKDITDLLDLIEKEG